MLKDVTPFTYQGRKGVMGPMADGFIKLTFEDGHVIIAREKTDLKVPKSSITSDANPEGVNQFTGAAGVLSAKAVKASKGAKSPKGHVKAMEAHHAAAQMHRQAAKGEGHLGSWHSAMAAGHEASAMQHSLGQTPSVHFGRNFGDFPKVKP